MKKSSLAWLGISLTMIAIALSGCKDTTPNTVTTTPPTTRAQKSSLAPSSPPPKPSACSTLTPPVTSSQIENYAQAITVRIYRRNLEDTAWEPNGSGVIIAREKDTYHVLTANHVMPTPNKFRVETPDKQAYDVDSSTIKPLEGGACVDLAVLQFASTTCYSSAQLGKPVAQGMDIYVFGWAEGTQAKFNQGKMVDPEYHTQISSTNSCTSLGYEAETEIGMSGGPVLDQNGRLIGIHIGERVFGPLRGTSIQKFQDTAPPEVKKLLKN